MGRPRAPVCCGGRTGEDRWGPVPMPLPTPPTTHPTPARAGRVRGGSGGRSGGRNRGWAVAALGVALAACVPGCGGTPTRTGPGTGSQGTTTASAAVGGAAGAAVGATLGGSVGAAVGEDDAAPAAGEGVRVSLSPAYRASGLTPTLEVDVVGLPAAEAQRLSEEPVGGYFGASGTLRRSLPRFTAYFDRQDAGAKTLPRDGGLWRAWQDAGAEALVVVANIPGFSDQAGPADPRRLVVPLSEVPPGGPVWIEVDRTGLRRRGDLPPTRAGTRSGGG